jgi:hypothetical protein
MSQPKGRYEPVIERSREEIQDILGSGNPDEICEALWSAVYYDPDWRWVQLQCLNHLIHSDFSVRCSAATLLGVLAVLRKKLDVDLVLPALHKAAEDPAMKPSVEDSLDDIRHTIKLQ